MGPESQKKQKKTHQTAPTSPHVVQMGFKKKKNSWLIQKQDTTGTSNGTGFYGQMKQKNSFLAASPPNGFGANRDKKYPMSTFKYIPGSIMVWACFSAGGPGHLFKCMASWILSNTNR